jgi:membrane protein required for colicin V production
MNWIDVSVALICLVFVCLGLVRGFVRQAVSLAGIVAGHLLGVRYYPWAQGLMKLDSPQAGAVAAYAAVFLAAYVAVRLLGALLDRWVSRSKLSVVNRLAGGGVGFAKGALLSILLVFLVSVFKPSDYGPMRDSKVASRALSVAGRISACFPEAIRDSFRRAITRSTDLGVVKGEEKSPAPHSKKRSVK